MLKFLAQRSGEALQRPLRDALVDTGGLVGGGADDDDTAAGADVAKHRGEELAQRRESLGGGDSGGVEDQTAERVGPAAADVVTDQVIVFGQRGAERLGDAAIAADQEGSGECRLAFAVAPEGLGLRDAQLLGQEGPGTGVDHLREQVGSHRAAFRVRNGVKSGYA